MDFDWFYKLQGIKIFLSSADIYPQFSAPLPPQKELMTIEKTINS